MDLSGASRVAAIAQIGLAGVTLQVAIDQVLVRWRGEQERGGGSVAAAGFAMATVLGANAGVTLLDEGGADVALFIRAAALSALVVAGVVAGAHLAGRRVARPVLAVVGGLAVARVALWLFTDLVYTHRFSRGAPVYGSALPWLNVSLLALALWYLVVLGVRRRTTVERVAAVGGVSLTVTLGALSMFVSDPVWAELLTGYLCLPLVVSLHVMVTNRLKAIRGAQVRHLNRQAAIAELGRGAMTRPLDALLTDAVSTVRRELAADEAAVSFGSTTPVRFPPVESFPLAAPIPGPSGDIGVVTATRTEPFDRLDDAFLQAVAHILGSGRERDRLEQRVRHQAMHDDLTGLPNRVLVRDRLRDALRGVDPASDHVVVLVVDVDAFKAINDTLGHPVGDAVLEQLAHRLRTAALGQIVGRLGGDSFVIVCPRLGDEGQASPVASAVLGAFREPLRLPAGQIHVTASVGIVVAGADADADALLRDADIAMRRAKEEGGDRAEVFDPELRRRLVWLLDVQEALEGAVDRHEIVAHYQPIIDLVTGEVVRLEALARWRRIGGLVAPVDWISVAEQTGAIDAIGCEMLRLAGDQLLEWLARSPQLGVSVNVSPRQLLTGQVLACVRAVLDSGLPPSTLCLEITESHRVEEGPAVETLDALRRLGCKVALDDFGVGYSSLAALARLPVDVIKIDREFTSRLDTPGGRELVAAMLTLANALDLEVIAEGIETQDQLDTLVGLGCTRGQGYLIVPPSDARDLPPPLAPAGG